MANAKLIEIYRGMEISSDETEVGLMYYVPANGLLFYFDTIADCYTFIDGRKRNTRFDRDKIPGS